MDAAPATANIAPKYRIWLPYWAVFQTDLRQTVRGWTYRLWVTAMTLTAFGYLLYRMGVHREAGLIQSASLVMSDLLRWVVLGSTALIAALTVGSISSERGTLADSVLSRGISRFQYYLAKWHSRLATVLGTFLLVGGVMLVASHFLLRENLTLSGSATALLLLGAFFTLVVSCGVTLSSMCNSTLLGMSLLWLFLYGGGFLLELLPKGLPTPDRVLRQMPDILQGDYDPTAVMQMLVAAGALSAVAGLAGMISFSRRDV
ncbi:MAG: ABC transporter permease [Gemmataceae bacterium]